MTFNVYYTDYASLDSSFVDQAWYDSTRNRLVLDLNGVVYEYYDVQKATFDDLKTAPSAGIFYRKNIQGQRHGNRLGNIWEANEIEAQPAGTFTKQEVRFHNGGYISPNGGAHFPIVSPDPAAFVIPNAVADKTKIQKISLKVDNNKSVTTFDYTLQFVVVDDDGEASAERSHTLQATSLDDAIEQMLDLADKLDQDILLKGASVRFE